MFTREAQMTEPAAAWLAAQGMTVKREFVTPWGHCDLAAMLFNLDHVAHRLALRQTQSLGSITRADLLLRIPEVEEGRSVTLENLAEVYEWVLSADALAEELGRLVRGRFVVGSAEVGYQKLNGWMPLHKRLVAVELKLTRVAEVLKQARNNLGFANESFVGLPADLAFRIAATQARRAEFEALGVGLLAVSLDGCEEVIPAPKGGGRTEPAVQLYSVEKFWGNRPVIASTR